jgi:serine/threonine protein phosphatase PrpC
LCAATVWCGDSRAVLAREAGGRMEVVALTQDHKPNDAGELERIDEVGLDTLNPVGPIA